MKNDKPLFVVLAFLGAVALFTYHAKHVQGAELGRVNAGATVGTYIEAADELNIDEVVTSSDEDIVRSAAELDMAAVHEPTPEEIEEEMYWDSLELLALVVEAEAGNQDLKGKRLVVDVVLNRVESELFPNTIEEVVAQNDFGIQFATYYNGAVDSAGWHMQEDDYTAVLMELDGRLDYDILYFTSGGYNPSGTPAYKYGDHYFSTK